MKHLLIPIIFISLLSSCSNKDYHLSKINKSFKDYIHTNDTEKGFETRIEIISAISYEEIEMGAKIKKEDAYKAKIFFRATTSYQGSSKVYNINDTVTSYFDKDFKMLRLVQPIDR